MVVPSPDLARAGVFHGRRREHRGTGGFHERFGRRIDDEIVGPGEADQRERDLGPEPLAGPHPFYLGVRLRLHGHVLGLGQEEALLGSERWRLGYGHVDLPIDHLAQPWFVRIRPGLGSSDLGSDESPAEFPHRNRRQFDYPGVIESDIPIGIISAISEPSKIIDIMR